MNRLEFLENISRELEPDRTARYEIAEKAFGYADNFIEALPEAPGYRKGSFTKLPTATITDEGTSFESLLDMLGEVDEIGINPASGGHLGYIPGGGIWASSIADMLVAVANRYAGIAYSNPGAVKIENQLISWLGSVVGYPETAHGNLTSGGSVASLIAVKAARDYYGVCSENVRKMVIYHSEQMHHCLHKAFHTTGLHEAIHRPISLNHLHQMDTVALKEQIEKDMGQGLRPFLVVATAGTTDTGAVDPLDTIADLCEEHNLWLHVDAAYGGFFMLLDDMKPVFKGIERSDSVVLDPHKTLFIPYGSGAVLVRDRNRLLASNSSQASYMQDAYGMEDISPSDTSIELSKHFRGLRMWLPLHLHGLKPFKASLEEKLLLCQHFHSEIGKLGFETGPAPTLSIAIFRYPGDDALNQRLIDALHDDGRVFMSSTTINGKLWIRCAVVSHRTHIKEIEKALSMIRENLPKAIHQF